MTRTRILAGAFASALVLTVTIPTHSVATARPLVCWVEPNNDTPEGVELLAGQPAQRPMRSVAVKCP